VSQRVGFPGLQGSYARIVRVRREAFHRETPLRKIAGRRHLRGKALHRACPSVTLQPPHSRAILPSTSGEVLIFFEFNEAYLRKLREGDPSTEDHFVGYFSELVRTKLRSRQISPDIIDDIKQETFLRVLKNVREGKVREAASFGAYFNQTINNVSAERFRKDGRDVPLEPEHKESPPENGTYKNPLDKVVDQEMVNIVKRVLHLLPKKDREILRAIYWLEMPKDEICKKFGVGRDYLRVLDLRAREKFRRALEKMQK